MRRKLITQHSQKDALYVYFLMLVWMIKDISISTPLGQFTSKLGPFAKIQKVSNQRIQGCYNMLFNYSINIILKNEVGI